MWVVNPEALQLVIYRPDGSVDVLRPVDVLRGDPILPGFECLVEELKDVQVGHADFRTAREDTRAGR